MTFFERGLLHWSVFLVVLLCSVSVARSNCADSLTSGSGGSEGKYFTLQDLMSILYQNDKNISGDSYVKAEEKAKEIVLRSNDPSYWASVSKETSGLSVGKLVDRYGKEHKFRENIFLLRDLKNAQGEKIAQNELHEIFLNYEKQYDEIYFKALAEALQKKGQPWKFVNLSAKDEAPRYAIVLTIDTSPESLALINLLEKTPATHHIGILARNIQEKWKKDGQEEAFVDLVITKNDLEHDFLPKDSRPELNKSEYVDRNQIILTVDGLEPIDTAEEAARVSRVSRSKLYESQDVLRAEGRENDETLSILEREKDMFESYPEYFAQYFGGGDWTFLEKNVIRDTVTTRVSSERVEEWDYVLRNDIPVDKPSHWYWDVKYDTDFALDMGDEAESHLDPLKWGKKFPEEYNKVTVIKKDLSPRLKTIKKLVVDYYYEVSFEFENVYIEFPSNRGYSGERYILKGNVFVRSQADKERFEKLEKQGEESLEFQGGFLYELVDLVKKDRGRLVDIEEGFNRRR